MPSVCLWVPLHDLAFSVSRLSHGMEDPFPTFWDTFEAQSLLQRALTENALPGSPFNSKCGEKSACTVCDLPLEFRE